MNDFLKALKDAQTDPLEMGAVSDKSAATPFTPPEDEEVVDETSEKVQLKDVAKKSRTLDAVVKRRVFVIYDPNNGQTHLDEYEEIFNKCVSKEYMLGTEREVDLKNGTILVSLKWYEPTEHAKKKKAARAAAEDGAPEVPIP